MCGTSSAPSVFNFCRNTPVKHLVNLQQCNPIFQPCPSPAMIYYNNLTELVVNGSFTVVNNSNHCIMDLVFVQGALTTNFLLTAGRSVTYLFEDLRSITIECQAGTIPEDNGTGNLLLDLHYCVECPNL